MHVSRHDYAQEYRALKPEIDAALQRVLDRAEFDWGPEVPAFEAAFAERLGVGHAVGVNSGTAALKIALLALGIGPGDEVITVPNSDISTTAAVHHVGAQPVWVDIEPDTLNMNPDLVEAAITPRTRALLPVHLYGHPADMPALQAIAQRHGLFVVEDACLALGAAIEGRPVGTWGHVAAFSHAPSKHLGTYGSGGTVVTDDAALAERMALFAGYGQPRERIYAPKRPGQGQFFLVQGLNERLDEFHAAILQVKLPHLSAWVEARRRNARAYTAAFTGTSVRPPAERAEARHTYRNYVVRVPHRDRVQARLMEAGISTALLYTPPLHLQPAYAPMGHQRGDFPVTEEACASLIDLPVGPTVAEEERAYVIETLLEAVEEV